MKERHQQLVESVVAGLAEMAERGERPKTSSVLAQKGLNAGTFMYALKAVRASDEALASRYDQALGRAGARKARAASGDEADDEPEEEASGEMTDRDALVRVIDTLHGFDADVQRRILKAAQVMLDLEHSTDRSAA